jgi:hypothetical protein
MNEYRNDAFIKFEICDEELGLTMLRFRHGGDIFGQNRCHHHDIRKTTTLIQMSPLNQSDIHIPTCTGLNLLPNHPSKKAKNLCSTTPFAHHQVLTNKLHPQNFQPKRSTLEQTSPSPSLAHASLTSQGPH